MRKLIFWLSLVTALLGALEAEASGESRMTASGDKGSEQKASLLIKVRTAFPSEPWRKTITEKDAYDSAEIERAFQNYRKGLVSEQVVFDQRGSLPAISPSGFVVVLPLYLEYVVRNPASDVTEKLAHFLLYAPSGSRVFVEERLSTLTPAQRSTLKDVLNFVGDAIEGSEPVLARVVREATQAISRPAS